MIVAPCEHLTFRCQHASKEITASDFDDGNVKVNHVRDRSDIFKFVLGLLGRDLILLNILTVDCHRCDSAHDDVRVLRLVVDAVEQSVHVARGHVVDDVVEHRVSDGPSHGAALISSLVLLDHVIGEAELRVRIVAPHVQASRFMQVVVHSAHEARRHGLVALTLTVLREDADIVNGIGCEVGDPVGRVLHFWVGLRLVHDFQLSSVVSRLADVDVVEDDF